ncbi:MAG: carbon monoxide dehydrogenase [Proteobacteria bacterium]|nr:MAG: carbon monoxide dehydrogenase [Pseudomonadota bacterium]
MAARSLPFSPLIAARPQKEFEMPTAGPFGAAVKRVEDPRFLVGQTSFVEGMVLPNMLSVAFLRSPYAHAKIRSIDVSKALALPGVVRVLTGEEAIKRCKPIRVEWKESKFEVDFKPCDYPAIAVERTRHVGEIVAAVVAENRYLAEDGVELIEVEWEPLPAVVDPEKALEKGGTLVHEEWGDNVMLHSHIRGGDVEGAFRQADVVVKGRFAMNRHCAAPMEGRAVVANYDAAQNGMTVWTSTQMPHMVRTKIAEALDYPEHRIRVIGPDVGGGFGLKCHIFPEELALSLLTLDVKRPLKWVEDRRENLYGSYHAKDDICYAELAVKNDGTILGLKTKFIGDVGAYTSYPWTPSFEPLQAAMAVPGPYKIHHVHCEALAVATNKTTSSVYRGVGLPAAQYTMEHILDLAAAKIGMDPAEIRRKNIMKSSDFPVTSVTGLYYDSATPLESLDMALEMIKYPEFRKEQEAARKQGKYLGIGISAMIEMTTFGFEYWRAAGLKSVTGYDSAHLRVDPNGGVTLTVGTFNHGQGHPTAYAQLVADGIGCKIEDVTFIQGDTQMTPYGWGTWGSRSAVAGGGAVIKASEKIREKMFRVAANLMEVSAQDLELKDGKVQVKGVPGKSMTIREVAQATVYTADVPDDDEPGLEASYYYKAPTPYANSTHIAVVEVDPETGYTKILRYVVTEDCGRMINPMIVDGQIAGGVAQGIGQAMFEHHQFDESGQILTTSLMDYLIPSCADVPPMQFGHLETPCPISVGGIKGMGEGGAVAPPPAIANAIADALAPLAGWKPIGRLPMSPEVVRRQIA